MSNGTFDDDVAAKSIHTEPIDGVFQDVATAVIQPPTWVIKDLLPIGLTFINAPPKANKSTLSIVMAAMVAGWECKALPPYLRIVERSGPSLLFSYEATAGEIRHMLEKDLGVTPRPDASMLVADDPWEFRLDDPDGQGRLLGWLQDRDPRLVVLDPLRDFHQREEKDSGEMNRLLRPLQRWAKDNESAFIIVHHSSKPSGQGVDASKYRYTSNDMRGSSAMFGLADAVLSLTPKADGQLIIHARFKRGRSWERTIQLAAFDRVGQDAHEVLSAHHLGVLGMVKKGQSFGAILAQMHIAKRELEAIYRDLQANGMLPEETK